MILRIKNIRLKREIRAEYDLSRLVESIRRVGQQMPIIVARVDRKYKLVDGLQRIRALKKLKRKTVQAQVLKLGVSIRGMFFQIQ